MRAPAVVICALACGCPVAALGAGPPIVVRASLEPQPAAFGDPVVAELDVRFDPGVIDPGSIQVEAGLAPYVQTGPPEVERTQVGSEELDHYRYRVSCLTAACLPGGGTRAVTLAPARVTGSAAHGEVSVRAAWPPARVRPRVTRADVAGPPRFRSESSSRRSPFRISPGALSGGLAGAALLFAVAGLALVGRELARPLRRGRSPGAPGDLEAALRYTRESALRASPADRRKALGLLAEALGEDRLAQTAGVAAWSEPPPSPARAVELADEVECSRRGG